MKAFLDMPGFLSPHGNLAVDITWLFAMLATVMFVFGWQLARTGRGRQHRLMMVSASTLMLAYFFIYYLSRNLGGIIAEGKLGFGGPAWMADFLLKPVLTVHVGLVMAVFLLIPYQVWLGYQAVETDGRRLKLSESTLKMRKGVEWRIFPSLAAVLLMLGVWRCESGHCRAFYAGLFVAVGGAVALERWLERAAPEGGGRHRKIGAVSLCAILLLFASTTTMYVMLHVLYAHAGR